MATHSAQSAGFRRQPAISRPSPGIPEWQLLAGLGVSSDVRAQLQSHGLGGIQTRHYDRHSYMAEKRAALELWESQLYRRKVSDGSAAAKKRQRVTKP